MPYKIVVKASARKEIERLPVNVTAAIDKKITMEKQKKNHSNPSRIYNMYKISPLV